MFLAIEMVSCHGKNFRHFDDFIFVTFVGIWTNFIKENALDYQNYECKNKAPHFSIGPPSNYMKITQTFLDAKTLT